MPLCPTPGRHLLSAPCPARGVGRAEPGLEPCAWAGYEERGEPHACLVGLRPGFSSDLPSSEGHVGRISVQLCGPLSGDRTFPGGAQIEMALISRFVGLVVPFLPLVPLERSGSLKGFFDRWASKRFDGAAYSLLV